MKTFHCTHCQHLVFFENIRCLNCGHALAYLPDRNLMAAVQQGEDGSWGYEGPGGQDQSYRFQLLNRVSDQEIADRINY